MGMVGTGMGQSMGGQLSRGGPRLMGPRMAQQQQGMGFDSPSMGVMNRQGMMGLPNQGMIGRPQQYKYTQVGFCRLLYCCNILVQEARNSMPTQGRQAPGMLQATTQQGSVHVPGQVR